MSLLQDFLTRSGATIAVDKLPLLHTANGEEFLSILKSGAIIPSACRVFHPDVLAYFFMGRPAYKTPIVNGYLQA